MDHEFLQAVAAIAGPLLGAGVGTFFGLRGAINGLRERSARMETVLGEVRDYARDALHALGDHDRSTDRRVHEIIEEVRRGRE